MVQIVSARCIAFSSVHVQPEKIDLVFQCCVKCRVCRGAAEICCRRHQTPGSRIIAWEFCGLRMKTRRWCELNNRPYTIVASFALLGEVVCAAVLEHLELLCTLPKEPCPVLEICCVDVVVTRRSITQDTYYQFKRLIQT